MMNEGEENEVAHSKIVKEWVSLAESGDTKRLGKSILEIESLGLPHLAACTQILMKANAENIRADKDSLENSVFYRAGLALIEALVQKKAAEELAKLAFFSWNTLERSPLSVRCLDAAIEVGSLDDLYDIGHRMHSKKSPKNVECAANLILKTARAGCRDAFFITGELFADGHGLQKDLNEARKWFLKAAFYGSSRASLELGLVPEAYLELAKLTKKPVLKNFYLHQADVCKNAKEALSLVVPGMEVESLIMGGENGRVEFKQCAVWETEILRDVAAFLNSKGGCLLIGVDDEGEVVGLGKSLAAAKVKDMDSYQQHMFQKMLSNYGAACARFITIDFPKCQGQEVCRINILPSTIPIYVSEGNNEKNFYIRTGNSKRKLTTPEAIEYCKVHFAK